MSGSSLHPLSISLPLPAGVLTVEDMVKELRACL